VFPLAVGPSTTTTSGSRSNFDSLSTFNTFGDRAVLGNSARAPRNIAPVTNDGENEQENRHDKQSGGFGGVDSVAVLMRVVPLLDVSSRLRRNRDVHAAIVAFRVC